MRKLLLLLSFLGFCLASSAQAAKFDANYNFKILNNNVAWQYVYITNKSASDIISHFRNTAPFSITEIRDSTIYGNMNGTPIDYKNYGFSTGLTPMYLSNSKCYYNIAINVQDLRYRVTITNVRFDCVTIMVAAPVPITLNEAIYNFNKNRFKNGFAESAEILSTVWFNTFLITDSEPQNDNW